MPSQIFPIEGAKLFGGPKTVILDFKIQSRNIDWIFEEESADEITYILVDFRHHSGNRFVSWPKLSGPAAQLP